MAASLRWPETLPQTLMLDGNQTTPPAPGTVIKRNEKVSPPIAQQIKFTGTWKTRGTLRMTFDQYRQFDAWFRETARYGLFKFLGRLLGSSEDEEFTMELLGEVRAETYVDVSVEIWRTR